MPPPVRWILLPENRAARQAIEGVVRCVGGRALRRAVNPLFVAGPPGSGKSHLATELVAETTRQLPDLLVAVVPAADLALAVEDSAALRQADLVVIEDVQHLPVRGATALSGLVDHCLARQRQLVLTAVTGPALLTHLPTRLTSRLAQGLTVTLDPLGVDSRRAFLGQRQADRGLTLADEALAWLAANTPGSPRQLDGALTRVQGLAAVAGRMPTLEEITAAFRDDVRPAAIDRIVQRVGRYFQVEPNDLRSERRSRAVLLPRQVGMYLARLLTPLSLEQIGAYFGGRDHSTVLHACRKVEQALSSDARLSGAVRELHADLA
ncbi:MAG: helix-turn-helix domain-containing protein [Gemmataceae bacterium]